MVEPEIRRRMRIVFVMAASGVVIVFLTLLAWRQDLVAEPAASVLFFAAALLIGGSAMVVALNTPYIPGVTSAVFAGATLVIFSQLMNALDGLPLTRRFPFFGRDGAVFLPYLDDILLFVGMGILLASTYLAILDALLVRARLTAESEKRQQALRAAEQYARALALSEARAWEQLAELENLYDTAPAGLCLVSLDGRFQKINHRMAQMDGLPPEAHIGQPVESVLREAGRTLAQICREVTLNGRARLNFELSVAETADGPETAAPPRVWLTSCFPISGQSGAVMGVQVVLQDITDIKNADTSRRHLEQQMQHAQKLESLGVLAGGIAHDFNNLLTGIMGNTGLVLERAVFDEKTRGLLDASLQAAHRAAELTQQMLAYAGQGAVKPTFLDLSRLAGDNLPLLRASVTKQAELTLDCPGGLSPVVGDPSQIQQVLMNLVTNASEALGPAGGRIEIRTGDKEFSADDLASCLVCDGCWPGRYVYLEVRDTGCGMDAAAVPRIFEPFYSTKFAGRGLGLAVAVGIIRRHRGAVAVESAPGEGSTFRVLFPAARPPVPVERGPAPADFSLWRGHGRVLVIDDEEMVRITAQEILEDMGFEVLCAGDGLEGERLFREHGKELAAVFLDLTMPGRNGVETYRALQACGLAVPIIVCSGYAQEHALHQFQEGQQVRFLQKPYACESIAAIMRELT